MVPPKRVAGSFAAASRHLAHHHDKDLCNCQEITVQRGDSKKIAKTFLLRPSGGKGGKLSYLLYAFITMYLGQKGSRLKSPGVMAFQGWQGNRGGCKKKLGNIEVGSKGGNSGP